MSERKITPLHYETLIKIFELDGFVKKRTKGDHIIMTKPAAILTGGCRRRRS